MRTLSDIQTHIIKEEYPTISLESDTDVERYFELRTTQRQSEALALYNLRIKQKYPDETQRTLLMKYYRSHDPRFYTILHDNLVTLAERIISRTIYIITILTKEIDTIDISDAYAVIKLVEGLLAIISPDRYLAVAFAEKYVRYAKTLNFKYDEMDRTAELIRLYVTDTIESIQEYKRENEEKKKQYARQQIQQINKRASFDLSKIVFTQTDIDRIVIPPSINRTEDIVISYSLKYWNLINDTAFEKTVFLYSRKYKTKNHEIYQAIKNGRLHNWKDEEILNDVLANVVSGYYYNISGDLYIQRTWAQIKASGKVQASTTPMGIMYVPNKPKKKKPVTRTFKTQKSIIPFKNKKRPITKPELPRQPVFHSNSIANILKKITGKSYTVFKDLFFQSIRPSIRYTLLNATNKKGSLFDNKKNTTEDIIFNFLFTHYNDPYQNWENSAEKKQVSEHGYHIPQIEPIIVHWVQHNQ